jgi:TonB family protein
MNYYEQSDKKGRTWGIVFAVVYAAVCVAVMFISFIIERPEPEAGVLIDFGTTETGGGSEDLALSESAAVPTSPQRSNVPEEPVMTTEEENAPAIAAEERPTEAQPAEQAPEPTPAREVNRRALFPGRTEGSTATSQGTSTGAGNQGLPEGGPEGSGSTGGSGSSGFSLSGRYLVGNLPRPAYSADAEGRVVVRITVNAGGNVTSAVYEQSGSTTNHGALVSAALAAAAKARFTAGTEEIQTGTITYIFRLQ